MAATEGDEGGDQNMVSMYQKDRDDVNKPDSRCAPKALARNKGEGGKKRERKHSQLKRPNRTGDPWSALGLQWIA